MIYEIFRTADAQTVAYVEQAPDHAALNRSLDYSYAKGGFYVRRVKDVATMIVARYFTDKASAQRFADMENMASDSSTFTVVSQ